MVIEKLASEAMNRIVRAKGIHSELKKWERSLTQIQAVLNDASHKEIHDEAVKRWLKGLQHLAYDIDDVLDGLATDTMHHQWTEKYGSITSKVRKLIPTCCTSLSLSNRMEDKLDDITTMLQDLVEEKNALGLRVKDDRRKNVNRKYETCLPDDEFGIFGREGDEAALINKLLGNEPCKENFSIIPITGMGGVGKTTLARLLYNETQVKDHFELKAWVCVSDEFDIFNISQAIFQSMTGESTEIKDLNQLQVTLQGKLKDRRFLVVLDDVWTESYDDCEKLMPPFRAAAPGSKVIMTTRKSHLLKQLGCNDLDHLKSLSNDDAVSLFALHAFGVDNFGLHPTLRTKGEEIVKKCDGLPLALKALGRLLRGKTDEDDWEDVLNSEIWTLEGRDGILPALRLSYRDLPAYLKQLFAYCSLFPKDYLFDKEELVLLWMAEGFLHQSTSGKLTERWGHDCFEMLLSRSFFQHAPNGKSLFVMHDLMNDLAISVAGNFNLRLDIQMKNSSWKEALKTCRHMSFVCEEYIVSKKFNGLDRAKRLRTFLALSSGQNESWETFYLSNRILTHLLDELPLLRVLSLSRLEISEVPEFIGNMKHLRYLNLSRTQITKLPENVCNLYNLQTLILYGCEKLTKLPNSFLLLKKLRHFDIRDTPLLNKLPSGIGELKSLQTLSKIIIGGDNGFTITELKALKNLHGIISIQGLDKVENAMHAEEANFMQKRLTELELHWSNAFNDFRKGTLEKEVLNALKPRNDNLVKLGIASYGGIEFPTWVGDPLFDRLTQVALRGCIKCTSLPPLGKLSSLKELIIEGMDGVETVGFELLGTSSKAFCSLEILRFQHMCGWKAWSSKSGVVDAVFPCLQELHIVDCPNLDEVSLDALPTLRVLEIEECGHGVLRSLVHLASSVIKLELYSISGLTDEVWGSTIQYLLAVEDVIIWNCNEIRYLWKSKAEASTFFVNLRKLRLHGCSNMVSLGEKEEDNSGSNLTSLRKLTVEFCHSMERCSCPNNIKKLRIYYCDTISRVSIPTGGVQKLKSLEINNCKKLLENELQLGEKTTLLSNNTRLSKLEYLHINHWPNVTSINGLSNFVHLSRLMIVNCQNMESFPDHELPNLTSLKFIVIKMCPSMNASFPWGHWPPKLGVLHLGHVKRPMREWGPQNFPTSLVKLSLCGTEEDVTNLSQLSHFLPSSLTSLWIWDFEKLESLSMGLQHLTSIKNLHIWNCPKMIDLPETLLPSLLSLQIVDCQVLKKGLVEEAPTPTGASSPISPLSKQREMS